MFLRNSSFALAAAAGLASAPSAQLDPIQLSLSQSAYEAGDILSLTLDAEPFHIPFLILGRTQGPTPIPGIGDFGVGLFPTPRIVRLKPMNASGSRTLTCDLECDSALLFVPMYIQALTFDPFESLFSGLSNTVALQQVNGDCGDCADEAYQDQFGIHGDGHALYLPGLDQDLQFVAGGEFVERNDGTARMLGVVRSASDPDHAFAIDICFADRIDPLAVAHPPAGSPKLELDPSAYKPSGPVDARDWRYYEKVEGILMGLDCYQGAVVEVSRRGPAFQVGLGANGKNAGFGGSGWLDWSTLEQPDACDTFPQQGIGDINIDMGGDCIDCTEEAGDHALTMQAFGNNFLFVSGGQFEEFVDGTARLAGTLENVSDGLNRWDVEILFSDRLNPGSPSYPPSGSPKKELSAGNYVENGGSVDTGTWHYYRTVVGTLVGVDGNAGLDVVVTRRGPAFQVGRGANGKNALHGASGWLDMVLAQDGSDSVGDINIDIGGECQ